MRLDNEGYLNIDVLQDTLCHELAHLAMRSGLHNEEHKKLKDAMLVWLRRGIRKRRNASGTSR